MFVILLLIIYFVNDNSVYRDSIAFSTRSSTLEQNITQPNDVLLFNNLKDNIFFSENCDKINTISLIMTTIQRKKVIWLKLSYYCLHLSSFLVWHLPVFTMLAEVMGGDWAIYSVGRVVSRGIGAVVFSSKTPP